MFASSTIQKRCLFRVTDGADTQRCHLPPQCTDPLVRDAIFAQSRLPEALARFLSEMDRKLDLILAHIQKDDLEKEFPYEGYIVQLGGDGITLECPQPLAPDDQLEIVIVLEEYPIKIASCIAQIQTIDKTPPVNDPRNSVYSAIYSTLRTDDREAIIRCIFQENRRIIREARKTQ